MCYFLWFALSDKSRGLQAEGVSLIIILFALERGKQKWLDEIGLICHFTQMVHGHQWDALAFSCSLLCNTEICCRGGFAIMCAGRPKIPLFRFLQF